MYLKKEATVLISTVIILALISSLGCFMYKMIKNNTDMGNLYNFDKDIYDLGKEEEEILFEFMKDLNKNLNYKLNGINLENNSEEDIFSKDFERTIGDSKLKYYKDSSKIILITNDHNDVIRKREINYEYNDEKVILIPTYKFKDNSE